MLQLTADAEHSRGLSNRSSGDCWESSLKMCSAAAGFTEHFWTQLNVPPCPGFCHSNGSWPGIQRQLTPRSAQ